MTLGDPLLALIKYCETLCEAACCGRTAFDFSPIHIASFLINERRGLGNIHGRGIGPWKVSSLRAQLQKLGTEAKRLQVEGGLATIDAMNQNLTAQQLSDLVATIRNGLDRALLIVAAVKQAEPSG